MILLPRPARDNLSLRLAEARDRIETAFDERLLLDDLAKEAAFSKFHFLRAFKEAYSRTPRQYLTEVRLNHARHWLKHTELPVTEICFRLGFESLGSFSTLFQRYTGEAPSAYRRRHQRVFALAFAEPRVLVPSCFLEMFTSP